MPRLIDPGSRHLRVLARRRIGILKLNRIKKQTQHRYQAALFRFQQFCWMVGCLHLDDEETLDRVAEAYIEALWEEGDSRSEAGTILSAIQWALQKKRILQASWSLFKAWSLLELPRRAPPLPALVLSGFVGFALTEGLLGVAATLMAAFAGFLRTTEFFTLTASQLHFSNEGCLIILPLTKSGQRRGGPETVHITDAQAVQLLYLASQRAVDKSKPLAELPGHAYRAWFRRAVCALRVEPVGFLPYSVRRGGATHAFSQEPNLPHILMIGRWDDTRTARIYITEGALFLTKLALSEESRTLALQYAEVIVHMLGLHLSRAPRAAKNAA